MEQSSVELLIPAAKLEAVLKGVQTAFGTTTIERIVPLSGGLSSARVYKITVEGKPYLLRLIMQPDLLTDPVRQFGCMNSAAAAGIAPKVHYTSVEDALAIIDYVEMVPLAQYTGTRESLLTELVGVVKAIHATPLFPELVNFVDGVDGFIASFKASRMLPESATADHFAYYKQVQHNYPRHDPDLVSSHNDLNYNNILFDGEKIWIIDWEVAFQNDRYADLATIANGFVTDETQEEFLLKRYFGDSLDEYKRARFFLMRQVRRMFYAMIMFTFAAASKPADSTHDDNMQVPRIEEFRKQISNGTINLESYEGKMLFGKIELNEALLDMKSPRFAAAIEQMQQHHRNPS